MLIVLLIVASSALTLGVPLGIALVATWDPGSVLVYRAVPSGPDDVEGSDRIVGDIYRGHMRTKLRLVAEKVPIGDLPAIVRSAAAGLRFVVCAGAITVIPVLAIAGIELGGPLHYGLYGIPGLLLTFGQFAARKHLLRAGPSSAKIARAVGYWTIVHNVALFGLAYAMASSRFTLVGAAAPVSPGVLAVLGGWALFSVWLGSRTLAASTALVRWRQAQNAM